MTCSVFVFYTPRKKYKSSFFILKLKVTRASSMLEYLLFKWPLLKVKWWLVPQQLKYHTALMDASGSFKAKGFFFPKWKTSSQPYYFQKCVHSVLVCIKHNQGFTMLFLKTWKFFFFAKILQFYWNSDMFSLHNVYGCFPATVAELGNCNIMANCTIWLLQKKLSDFLLKL